MKNQNICYSDAAAVSYIKTCLKFRAMRLHKKWSAQSTREQPTLNSFVSDQDITEQIDLLTYNNRPLEHDVIDKIFVEQAFSRLTEKEKVIITRLFHYDMKIREICDELRISKNTVLKTRRNALKKMRAYEVKRS